MSRCCVEYHRRALKKSRFLELDSVYATYWNNRLKLLVYIEIRARLLGLYGDGYPLTTILTLEIEKLMKEITK